MSAPQTSSGPPSHLFVRERRVPWGDADPAGTLYFAHVSRYCMEALEQWFMDRLGTDWSSISADRGMGTPMVRAEIDFTGAAMVGDVLAVSVAVEKLGRSSLVLRVEAQVSEERRSCWQARFTCVFINAKTRQSVAIPDEYRAVIEQDLHCA